MSSASVRHRASAPERHRTVAERIATSDSNVVHVTSLEVEAAKLRLVTDRKQGRESPLWVRKLAAAKD
ncbi:hypothetical protein MF406_03785 [Georgenia sp. TF02-10]|uniref:hypothetical protein n=1 Tax=Georgenia sp. TF02-10 TaxID=2917725 RepID=UPI001FA70E90|nr:hypothetical protein [Georgenia sp. TF02-10]UNX55400.1 hypothetical protein MF406_03785 [Georgenia sp. TF02-10]